MIFDDLFEETCKQYKHFHNIAQKKVTIKHVEFIGMNWVVDYSFRLKDRCRMDTKNYKFQSQFGTGLLLNPKGLKEIDDWFLYAKRLPTIADELEALVRPEEMSKSVYIFHIQPAKLGLDACGGGQQVGSHAVHNFLDRYQPKLSLHGHIHESSQTSGIWKTALKNTMCIQPGQLSPLTYVTIDFVPMEIERHTQSRSYPL